MYLLVINNIPNVLGRFRTVLNRVVTAIIESQRDNFATGWPELGIGPIDPYYLESYEIGNLQGITA